MNDDFRRAAEFHGHTCPGLAIGYRVAKYVLEHHRRSRDEELVTIAENRSCSVDAIQELLGCTIGKGNLMLLDHGKQAFTVYSREGSSALRIYFRGENIEGMDRLRRPQGDGEDPEALRQAIISRILSAPDDEVLSVREVSIPAPERARIYPSIRCQECGESFMEIMGRTAGGRILCKGCFKRLVC